jgi:hypothetical protein
MSTQKKVILSAPLLTLSGYGEQGRFALRSLLTRPDLYDVYIDALNWGKCGWLHEDNEERRIIDGLLQKTIAYKQSGPEAGFDISIQCTIPNEWQKIAPINIGYTAGMETTRVAHQWLEKAKIMDRIIVVSNHSKNTFDGTVYEMRHPETDALHGELRNTTPVDVVNYPVKNFEPSQDILDLKFGTSFNLLCVAQSGPRKNVFNTIKWFIEEFHDDKSAGLVLKIFTQNNSLIDREHTLVGIKRITKSYQNMKCKIHLLHGNMTDTEVNSLYTHPKIKGLLSLTHGEGFGLPLFEAAYNGLPVIAAPWSGQMDFLMATPKSRSKKKTAKPRQPTPHMLEVDYTLVPVPKEVVWEGVLIKDSMWAEPVEASAKKCMRSLKEDSRKHKTKAANLKRQILENFTSEKMHSKFVSSVESAATPSAPQNVQVFT